MDKNGIRADVYIKYIQEKDIQKYMVLYLSQYY